MSDFAFWPIVAAAALTFSIFVRRRVMLAAQPLRIELAKKGEALLARQDLPPLIRAYVSDMLGSAFGCRSWLIAGLFAIPIIAVLVVFRQRAFNDVEMVMRRLSPEAKAELAEVSRLHDRVMLANHPFLMPAVEILRALIMPLAILIRGFLRGAVPATADRDVVMALIEERRGFWPRLTRA